MERFLAMAWNVVILYIFGYLLSLIAPSRLMEIRIGLFTFFIYWFMGASLVVLIMNSSILHLVIYLQYRSIILDFSFYLDLVYLSCILLYLYHDLA